MSDLKISEEDLQRICAGWLDRHGIIWFHSPNEGKVKPQYGKKRKELGVKAGVPDCWIVTPPPAMPDKFATVVELKVGTNKLTEMQARWLEYLKKRGYHIAVCRTFEEFLAVMKECGYGEA